MVAKTQLLACCLWLGGVGSSEGQLADAGPAGVLLPQQSIRTRKWWSNEELPWSVSSIALGAMLLTFPGIKIVANSAGPNATCGSKEWTSECCPVRLESTLSLSVLLALRRVCWTAPPPALGHNGLPGVRGDFARARVDDVENCHRCRVVRIL